MAKNEETVAPKRQHAAAYTKDKFTGGYNIRIVGPQANQFAGREVPVTRNGGEEQKEKLVKLLWTGIDDGEYNPANKGKPVALYSFEPHPREAKEVEF
jgi:hypothetical protein